MFVEGCEVEGEKGEMFLQVGGQGICLSSSEYFSVFKFMSVFFFFLHVGDASDSQLRNCCP